MITEKQLEIINGQLTAIEKMLRALQPPPVMVSVERAAELLGVSSLTVFRLICRKVLPGVFTGSRWMVPMDRLKELWEMRAESEDKT